LQTDTVKAATLHLRQEIILLVEVGAVHQII
jgi:hypothetical protein